MDASLHLLRLRALLRLDDGRGDLSPAVWLDCAVCLHEHPGRAGHAWRRGPADRTGRLIPGRPRPRRGPQSRVGTIARGTVPRAAVPDEPDGTALDDPARAAVHAGAARRAPRPRARAVRHAAVRQIRTRNLQSCGVDEISAGRSVVEAGSFGPGRSASGLGGSERPRPPRIDW